MGECGRAQGVLLLEEHDVWGHLPTPSAPGPLVQQSEGSEVPQSLKHQAVAHGLVPVLPPHTWHSQSPALSPSTTGSSPYLWDVFQGVPSKLSLELSFCTYPQCRGPRLAEPLVQTIGARPGPESQASLGTSGLRVPLSQSSEQGCSGVLENYLAGVWTEGQRAKGLEAEPLLDLGQQVPQQLQLPCEVDLWMVGGLERGSPVGGVERE